MWCCDGDPCSTAINFDHSNRSLIYVNMLKLNRKQRSEFFQENIITLSKPTIRGTSYQIWN